ncbi:MAG: Ppx/GppA phosphatase family protein [Bacteroidota bacterium]
MKQPVPLIGAIDVGTNSFHMVIASVNNRGALTIHSRDKEMVRLGSSGNDMKYLSDEAIERGVEALKRFAEMAKKEGATVRAIATSAVREALNRDEFLEKAFKEAGIRIEVVSGMEEGRLIYIGAIHAIPILHKHALTIDIGGGSTETTIGLEGDIEYVHSAKLGAIRLAKKFFTTEKITHDQIRECREYIRGDWAAVFKAINDHGFDIAVGCSGTIHTLAAMALAREGKVIPEVINGMTVKKSELLQSIGDIIEARTSAERAKLPGMDPKRADIIHAGALILEQAILGLNIQKMCISGYALREGIVFDTVQKQRSIDEFHHLSNLRYQTVYHIADMYKIDKVHAEHVKDLSLKIFDDLAELHKLGDTEREILEAAALLHDVGYHISPEQHHKHSYYMIRNSVMPGFTNDEAEIIANVARYHRKSHPKKKHENFQFLPPGIQRTVKLLAGILRIAEGLDRRQAQLARSVQCVLKDGTIEIRISCLDSDGVPDIEIWGARRRKDLLESIFEKNIIFLYDMVKDISAAPKKILSVEM